MTDDPEDFSDVTPDPEGVLEEFGIDDLTDLIDQATDDGPDAQDRHDPATDDAIDATDCVASDLFAELGRVARELEASESVERSPPGLAEGTTVGFDETNVPNPEAEGDRDAGVTPGERFAATWERTRKESETGWSGEHAGASQEATSAGLTLSGPSPEPIRIPNDAFGTV